MSIHKVEWKEGTGVQSMNYVGMRIVSAIVSATNGATKDITTTIRDMVVHVKETLPNTIEIDNHILEVNTATINDLTGGDIAFGFVKTLTIECSFDAEGEILKIQSTLDEFAEFQVKFDLQVAEFAEFQLNEDKQVEEFEKFQVKFDLLVADFAVLQAKFDKQVEEFAAFQIKFDLQVAEFAEYQAKLDKQIADFDQLQTKFDAEVLRVDNIEKVDIYGLKKADFDQDVLLTGLLQTVYDLNSKVDRDHSDVGLNISPTDFEKVTFKSEYNIMYPTEISTFTRFFNFEYYGTKGNGAALRHYFKVVSLIEDPSSNTNANNLGRLHLHMVTYDPTTGSVHMQDVDDTSFYSGRIVSNAPLQIVLDVHETPELPTNVLSDITRTHIGTTFLKAGPVRPYDSYDTLYGVFKEKTVQQ